MAEEKTLKENEQEAAPAPTPAPTPAPAPTPTPAPAPTPAPTGDTPASGSMFQIPKEQVDNASLKKLNVPNVRNRIQTEFESDRGYHMVADRIITVSQKHLSEQQKDKVYLRKKFTNVFSALLILEYIFGVLFILLDAITIIPVNVPESVLQLYITSVFLQTLSAMGVMIAFAFVSKEETRIVGLLNQIIQNYQKVNLDDDEQKDKTPKQ